MNVTVFGATGAIGSLTVTELLDRGHTVTAHARNPAKVPADWDGRVQVVTGELSDTEAMDAAVAGADAVISALGPSLDRTATGMPLVQGTANVLAAMHRQGVRRYVGHATPSVLDPREKPTFRTRLPTLMARTFLRRAYKQIVAMSALVTDSGLDWTIVRFTAPKDGPATGSVRAGFYGTDRIGFAVTRADIAAFTATQIEDDTYLRAAPAISN